MNTVLSLFSSVFCLHDFRSVVKIDNKTGSSFCSLSVLNIRDGKDNMFK